MIEGIYHAISTGKGLSDYVPSALHGDVWEVYDFEDSTCLNWDGVPESSNIIGAKGIFNSRDFEVDGTNYPDWNASNYVTLTRTNNELFWRNNAETFSAMSVVIHADVKSSGGNSIFSAVEDDILTDNFFILSPDANPLLDFFFRGSGGANGNITNQTYNINQVTKFACGFDSSGTMLRSTDVSYQTSSVSITDLQSVYFVIGAQTRDQGTTFINHFSMDIFRVIIFTKKLSDAEITDVWNLM